MKAGFAGHRLNNEVVCFPLWPFSTGTAAALFVLLFFTGRLRPGGQRGNGLDTVGTELLSRHAGRSGDYLMSLQESILSLKISSRGSAPSVLSSGVSFYHQFCL
jgi:hypothetical protein